MKGLKVLAIFGQLKNSRVANEQTSIVAEELSKNGTLYKKEVFFNIFINLPVFILSIIPIWLLIKRMDDFKDIQNCDVIVVSGKKMIRFARHLRHHMFPNAKIVQIGNPLCKIRKSDILIRQETSKFIFTGKNVIKVNGLLCKQVSNDIADEEMRKFDKIRNMLKGEFISVFIGGERYNYKISTNDAEEFGKIVSKISHNMKMPLLIATDGRIKSDVIDVLKRNLDCSYYFYEKNKQTESPKVAFMCFSKYYILFGNNINDQSEYIAQEKPTYVYLNNKNNKRYLQFINVAVNKNSIKILTKDNESLDDFVPKKMNDLQFIANQVENML